MGWKKPRRQEGGEYRRFMNYFKRYNKYMIILVGAVMLFSGLWAYGMSREQPEATPNEPSASWRTVNYDSADVSASSTLVKVTGYTGKMKLIPKNPSVLNQQSLADVFESNITGVGNIFLETAPSYIMFDLEVDSPNATFEIRKRVRLPGDYRLYNVYQGLTQFGYLNVVGEELAIGEYVRVFVLDRKRGGLSDLLGFVQNRVPEGPIVKATVLSFERLLVKGICAVPLAAGNITAAMNASDVRVGEEAGEGNKTMLTVTFTMSKDANATGVVDSLAALNVTNVTFGWSGYSKAPAEMIVNGSLFQIPDNEMLQTNFEYGTKVNDTVDVSAYVIRFGNSSIAFAIESPGNGTRAQ